MREAIRAGNCTLDIEAQWLDYAAAGVADAKAMEERILEMRADGGSGGDAVRDRPAQRGGSRTAARAQEQSILRARETMRERLQAARN